MSRVDEIQKNFEERGYVTDEENYELLLLKREGPAHQVIPDAAKIARYRGILPDMLLQFWAEQGFSSWNQGALRVCDPDQLQPFVDDLFAGDPDYGDMRLTPFAYGAFGELFIWIGDYRYINVNWYFNTATERTYPKWNDFAERVQSEDNAIISLLDSEMYVSKSVPMWPTDDDQDLYRLALKRLGELGRDEIYGLVPALSLGGANVVTNVHKFPVLEHLSFLASVQTPVLQVYHPPAEGEAGFGRIERLRPIGPQE